MLYTAEIERFETERWAVVRVKDVYYYVPRSMLPSDSQKGDQIIAAMSDGKIRCLLK